MHFLRPDLELIDPYYVGLRLGIESRCQALQCETVKLYHTDSMPEPPLLQSADGVIAIGMHSEAEVDWLGALQPPPRLRRLHSSQRRDSMRSPATCRSRHASC